MSRHSDFSDYEKDPIHGEEAEAEPNKQETHSAKLASPSILEAAETSIDQPDATTTTTTGDDLEKTRSLSVHNIKSVPNGGALAWLQVLGTFFIMFNSWGVINTYGTYQTFYETDLLSSQSPSTIAWIGSVQGTLALLFGMLTGPVYDAGYVHELLLTGSFLVCFGQMMLSLCHEYWQIMLAQGVCVGIGAGFLFVPGVAILSTYFSTKLSFAIGIAATGSSLGGVIYPIVLYRLLPRVGFPWATRAIGFIVLGTLLVTNLVMKVRVLPSSRRKFLDLRAFTEAPYLFFVVGMTIGFLGLYTPFYYVQSFVIDKGLAGPDLAFYLIPIINSASVFGRIIPNYLADYAGPINMLLPCTLVSGALCLCLIAAEKSLAAVIVVVALYGFTSGCFVSIPPPIFVSITKDRARIGTRIGMGFSVIAIGILTGTPISGAILNSTGDFTYVWLFGGLMTITGSVFIAFARVAKAGLKINTKA